MIKIAVLLLLLANFIAIGLLPVLFFKRDGQYNLRWLATAAPFFIVPAGLLLAEFGLLEPMLVPAIPLQAAAAVLSALSIGLIVATVRSHQVPLALWHQDNDAPEQLVTWGPYARIRHPFYTSFLLAFAAACVFLPHPLTMVCLVYGATALTVTARREEQRLADSEFGAPYRAYLTRTGRFFPRFFRRVSA